MKITEFKAWFEGFTENMDGPPTEAQFARMKAKVAEIDDVPVTERVFVDTFVRPYRKWWNHYWLETSEPMTARLSGAGVDKSGVAHIWDPERNPIRYGSGSLSAKCDDSVIPMNVGDRTDRAAFDSHAAMRDLGRMEAAVA